MAMANLGEEQCQPLIVSGTDEDIQDAQEDWPIL
jgi:hypothetical protein